MMKYLFMVILLGVFYSCSNNVIEESVPSATDTLLSELNPKVSDLSSEDILSVEKVDSLFPSEYNRKNNSILQTAYYHGDEVWNGAEKERWKALVFRNGKWSIEAARIKLEPFHDAILDAKGEMTGVRVQTVLSDSVLLLINESVALYNRKEVAAVKNPPVEFSPNDTFSFSMLNSVYRIIATGTNNDGDQMWEVNNYQLLLQYQVEGEWDSKLIVAYPEIFERLPQVLFIGDLDGDEHPDILLDKSVKDNLSNPALFMFKGANSDGEMFFVAEHLGTGC